MVGRLLTKLHWIAIVSGIVYLLSSLAYSRLTDGTAHVFALRHVLICVMLALTLISQFWITPRMITLRAQVATLTPRHARPSRARAIRCAARLVDARGSHGAAVGFGCDLLDGQRV